MIEQREVNDIVIISFEDDRQLHDAEPLRDCIKELIAHKKTKLLIDLGNITYLSSSVLGVIVTSYREFKDHGGSLKLVNVQPSVNKLFSITRLDRILEIFNDEVTAVNSF